MHAANPCAMGGVCCACRLPQQAAVNAAAAGSGPASLAAAVQQAAAALPLLQPPASAGCPALAPAAGPAQHTPDEAGWEAVLSEAVGALRAAAAAAEEQELQQQQLSGLAGGSAAAASAQEQSRAGAVDTEFARQEFIAGGQQVRCTNSAPICTVASSSFLASSLIPH
jgi:hypothetical protein